MSCLLGDVDVRTKHTLLLISLQPRMTLLECGWWGHPDTPLQSLLDNAFKDFKKFCEDNRIPCSQPPFTVRLVTHLHACAQRAPRRMRVRARVHVCVCVCVRANVCVCVRMFELAIYVRGSVYAC